MLANARDTVTGLMARHSVPGLSVAVTDASRLLLAEGFGCRDLSDGQPVTPDTRFLWFSMSKIATATVAMRLAGTGQLDLDAPVHSLVPGYRSRSGPHPVIRQLLNHTAGAANPLPLRWVLPGDASDEDARAFADRILARHGRPTRRAGGAARYSNVGYLVLAKAIERVSGESLETHVRHAVLEPVGMTTTGYSVAGTDLATGYVRLPPPLVPLLRAVLPTGVVGERHGNQTALRPFRVAGSGYGGLIGSAVDAARLLRLHLADGAIDGRRVLAADRVRSMREIVTLGKPFDLGLGWFRRSDDRDAAQSFVEHWGTGLGYWNAMRLYPGLGLGIVVMANTTRPYDHAALMSAVLASVGG